MCTHIITVIADLIFNITFVMIMRPLQTIQPQPQFQLKIKIQQQKYLKTEVSKYVQNIIGFLFVKMFIFQLVNVEEFLVFVFVCANKP